MTLSVIVPVYNSEKYLNRCLDSILAQTRLPDEIICVNDGSTDGSGEILKEYENKNPVIRIINKENGGLVSARKAGVRAATGDYITYVDSDDFIDSVMYENLMHYANEYKADVVTSGIIRDYGNHILHENEQIVPGFYEGERYKNEVARKLISTEEFFRYNVTAAVWNKLFKREKLLPVQESVNDIIRMGEDDAVTFPFFILNSSAYFCGEAFYHYCIRPDSMQGTIDPLDDKRLDALFERLGDVFLGKDDLPELETQYKALKLNFLILTKTEDTLEYDDGILYPFGKVEKNERIALYGAGSLGLKIGKWLKKNGFNIVAHVDKTGQGEGIEFPERLKEIEFDKLLLTVTNAKVKNSIKIALSEIGIEKDKIIGIAPIWD